MPVGPLSAPLRPAAPDEVMASRARRFFTTLYSADTALSCLRRSESWDTVSPRYSARKTVVTPVIRVFRSSIASALACVGTLDSSARRLLEQVGDGQRVDRHARTHRARHGERPEIGALGGGGLGPHDRLDQRHRVVAQ